mmetsp:Transcript_12955/g.29852  ORF Transcript_12955/g.29852 Transcript_12955/m.29852 type:complete len:234 (-) Transcript_12955:698-1399(-)
MIVKNDVPALSAKGTPQNRKFLPKWLVQKTGTDDVMESLPIKFSAATRPCCMAEPQCSILTRRLSTGNCTMSPQANRCALVPLTRQYWSTVMTPSSPSGSFKPVINLVLGLMPMAMTSTVHGVKSLAVLQPTITPAFSTRSCTGPSINFVPASSCMAMTVLYTDGPHVDCNLGTALPDVITVTSSTFPTVRAAAAISRPRSPPPITTSCVWLGSPPGASASLSRVASSAVRMT